MAQYQQVKIGEISKKYRNSLSQEQLYTLIQEIKTEFESQLGFSVFDYSANGHPIDILYVSESQKKKRRNRYLDRLASLQTKIEQSEKNILDEKSVIEKSKKEINQDAEVLNQSIENLNNTILKINQTIKSLNKEEYDTIKQDIESEQATIENAQQLFKKRQKQLQRDIRGFHRITHRYNSLISQYNALVVRIETLSKSIVEIKGKAIGKSVTEVKTYYSDGKQITEKNIYNEMEKIEIYGFDGDLNQLKAILAHELGHLLGVGHIDKKRALMNPLLQSNQVDKLELIKEDIKAFKEAFQ